MTPFSGGVILVAQEPSVVVGLQVCFPSYLCVDENCLRSL